METITATELARHTRDVLDRVATRGESIAVERNHALIATIVPPEPTMTASQALAGLPQPTLTMQQASAWLKDCHEGFDNAVVNRWA